MLLMNKKTGQIYIVGMDGGIDSAVAAYLLKKQGHSPIGVAVTYHEDDGDFKELISPFLPDELDRIKQLCQILEIPFYATNASELYFEEVVEKTVSARLTGNSFVPNVGKVSVILKTLISKMTGLSAVKVSTGHYAKVLRNQTTGQLNVYVANDIAEDDSFYISSLSSEVLENIYFPLSELKEEEVLKISKLIPFDFKLDKKQRRLDRHNFMNSEGLAKFVEKYSATSLRKEGQVYNFFDGSTIGEHLGIHQFFRGQKKIPLKSKAQIDKELVVSRIVPANGMIFLDKESRLYFTHLYVSNFICDKNLNRSVPMIANIMLGARKQMHSCEVFFKNNGTLFIKLKEELKDFISRGAYIVLYNKIGVGARVIGGGIVRYSAFYDENEELAQYPKTKDQEDNEEDKNKQKKKDLGF
ncbi:tRNA methyl transferase [Bacteriovorax sp. Seq25_V]|nr:tRNA methyl transferase [Bacteriovorax sp. Seq25_V]